MANLYRLSLLLAVILGTSLLAQAQEAPITTGQAKDNVGQTKTVVGTVMKISPVGKLTILDVDGVYPNSPFQAVIFGDKLPSFDQATLNGYQGKSVSITGKIALHKDRPQIILNEPSQIALSGAPAAPAPAAATTESQTAATTAPPTVPATETPASSAPSVPPGKSLLVNSNWNKGKKGWELPAGADVVTEGESQVAKIALVAGDRVTLKQVIETKIPKDTKHFSISFDAKLSDGSKISDGITVRLGQSAKESTYHQFKDIKTSWQTLKWDRTGDLSSMENLIFSVELDQGEGTVLLDNIQLLPLSN